MSKFISISITHPHLLKEWDYVNNASIGPDDVSRGSSRKVAWVCQAGHRWNATVANRAGRNSGCRTCQNAKPRKYPNRKPRQVTLEYGKTLAALGSKELISEWAPHNKTDPSRVSAQSNKNAEWVCKKGHEWTARIQNRFLGAGCPVCSGFRVLRGETDLGSINPTLSLEWHPTKNEKLSPDQVKPFSAKKVWWLGPCGHEWESSIAHRSGGSGCVFCSGHAVLEGFNDILSSESPLLEQWHPTKNTIAANQISEGSNKKVWWICAEGHDWVASPSDRKRTGCPECVAKSYVSAGEQELYETLIKYVPDLVSTYREAPSIVELDMYSPSKRVAIEYNGLFWHSEACKPRLYHYDKMLACEAANIELLTVWEDDWQLKPRVVLNQILSKLGVLQQEAVSARSCSVVRLDLKDARTFLDSNHIQGSCLASAYLGLLDLQKNIRAVLAITKTRAAGTTYRIDRYATNANVRGGFTKLLTHAERTYSIDSWITFADKMHSNGGLYISSGFEGAGDVPPDYKYHYRNKRVHKFNFRKDRIKKNPDLKHEEGLTELELTKLNNINRIWDAGKIKFVKKVRSE